MGTVAWELPWRDKHVPHAAIDILDACNISCRACYNINRGGPPKNLGKIHEELDSLLNLRRLHSVSVLGGEVTLHPQLHEIVRTVRQRGLHVELFTNGVDVDKAVCDELKTAGVDLLFFHIERGQKRPDLSAEHTSSELNELRREKAIAAARAGLDVGLTMTVYPGEIEDLRDVVSLTLEMPEVNYLVLTLFRDDSTIESLEGNIDDGITGDGTAASTELRQNNREMATWIREHFGLEPFASMGSSLDAEDPRWLSYLVGTAYNPDGSFYAASVKPTLVEKAFLAGSRIFRGQYPMYMKQDPDKFRYQLLLNGWLGGNRVWNRKLLTWTKRPESRLTAKRILLQNPAELSPKGQLIHCRWCPDAVVKNGALVPVCCADKINTTQ